MPTGMSALRQAGCPHPNVRNFFARLPLNTVCNHFLGELAKHFPTGNPYFWRYFMSRTTRRISNHWVTVASLLAMAVAVPMSLGAAPAGPPAGAPAGAGGAPGGAGGAPAAPGGRAGRGGPGGGGRAATPPPAFI